MPVSASRKEYTATSREAELESPPPKGKHSGFLSGWIQITIQLTYGNRSSNHRVEPATLEGTVEVGDHSLDILCPFGFSAFGRFEILDGELDLLGVVARLAEGHHAAEDVLFNVVAGAIRAISPP